MSIRPSRDEETQNLLPETASSIGARLDACLEARAYLHAELLADPLEAKSFGINAANAADVLERRLQLLETAVRKLGESSEAGGVNERPLCALGLGRTDLWKGYIPLALLLKERLEEHRQLTDGAFVLGINAPPGSGKSTLVQVLLFLLSVSADRPLRAVQLSSDDLYMGKAARDAEGITTRLDPRSLDPVLHDLVSRLKRAAAGEEVQLPRFNKGRDEREVEGSTVRGPFDIVLYEGWRVGVERGELWTEEGAGGAFDYSALNRELDFLVYIDADLESVWRWKQQSSRHDHEREVGPWGPQQQQALEAAWRTWIVPFIEKFERPLASPGGGADIVLAKSSAHAVLRIDLRSQLRRYYDLHLGARPSMSAATEALRGAFGRASLASGLLQRESSSEALVDETAADASTVISFDAFANAAEAMLSSSGAWAEPVWHRLVTGSSSNFPLSSSLSPAAAAASRWALPFRCAALTLSSDADTAGAGSRLAAELGGAPSLVLIHAPSAAALERAASAVSASAACAGAPVHGCTSCLGTLHDGAYLDSHATLFGIKDDSGRYCTAATLVETPAGRSSADAWHQAAARAVRDALDQAGAVAGSPLPLVLLHATPGFEEAVLAGIASVLPGATVFGGSAADGGFDPGAWLLASGSVTLGAPALAIALLWPSVSYSLSLSCMHTPAAEGCAAVVTSVADGGRTLVGLDGADASEVYARWSDASFDLSVAPESRTTLKPLARSVTSSNGAVHHFPLHPHGRAESDCGGLALFAAAREGETLTLLNATHEMLVENTKHAAARASAATAGGVSGVVAIVCAGVALELERSDAAPGVALGRLARVVHAAVASSGGPPPPLVGCFTFGEQGPLASEHESCHANLMLNVLVFGGAADDREEGGASPPLTPRRRLPRHVVL